MKPAGSSARLDPVPDRPEAASRRDFFRRLASGAAAVTAEKANAQAAPQSPEAMPQTGRQSGTDFYEFHGCDAYAYTQKDGSLAVEEQQGKARQQLAVACEGVV